MAALRRIACRIACRSSGSKRSTAAAENPSVPPTLARRRRSKPVLPSLFAQSAGAGGGPSVIVFVRVRLGAAAQILHAHRIAPGVRNLDSFQNDAQRLAPADVAVDRGRQAGSDELLVGLRGHPGPLRP